MRENLTGQRFGKLVAIRPGERTKSGRTTWVCLCDCGKEKQIPAMMLKNGDTKSCGCAHYTRAPREDLTGHRFGRLTAEEYLPGSRYRCRCDCGKEMIVRTDRLNAGTTRSCGCFRRDVMTEKATKHGGATEPLYSVLNMMHQRCENPKSKDFSWYGAKGVTVCPEWSLANYAAFREWALSSGYQPGLTIDRIDPTGPYSPSNCRWISIQDQQLNKRRSKR